MLAVPLLIAYLQAGAVFKIRDGKPYINKLRGLNAGIDLEISAASAKILFRRRMIRRAFVCGSTKFYGLRPK